MSQAGPGVVRTATGGGAWAFLMDTTRFQGAHSSGAASAGLGSMVAFSLQREQRSFYLS